MNKPVAIVIVAWNQLEKTLDCLKTVYAQSYKQFEVILVDNGSQENFQDEIRSHFPQLTLLSSQKNLGFAGGNNIGIRYALAHNFETVFLLNNDTLLDPDCLETLTQGLASSKSNVGLVTAKIYFAHEPNRIWSVGANFRPWLCEISDLGKGQIDTGNWSEIQSLEFAPFCGVLFKREIFEQLGLLDEGYFLYYEDMDYCQKLMLAGKKILLIPQAKIWHAVSASSGGGQSAAALYWLARSSGRYFRTYGSGWRLFIIIPYRLASALRKTIELLFSGKLPELKSYWIGLKDGWISNLSESQPALDN